MPPAEPRRPVTKLDAKRGETSHRWPVFLPDGKRFLYSSRASASRKREPGIYVGSLDSNEGDISPADRRQRGLRARISRLLPRRKPAGAEVRRGWSSGLVGEPFALAEDIQFFPQQQAALFSASANGVLVSQPRSDTSVSQLMWLDRTGKPLGTLGPPANQANPRISPDGKRVALDIVDPQTGNQDVWIYESGGGLPTRLTSDPSIDALPTWSPDGSRVALMSLRRSHPDIFLAKSDGSSGEEIVSRVGAGQVRHRLVAGRPLPSLSRERRDDESRALDVAGRRRRQADPVSARFVRREPRPVLSRREVGRLRFERDRPIRRSTSSPFPGPGSSWRVSTAGGTEPRWRRDGKELYYLAPDGKLMVGRT